RLSNIVGADPGDVTATGGIQDDDGDAATPVLVARDDRFVVLEQGGEVRLDVIANDAAVAARLAGGRLSIASAPTGGGVSIHDGGTAGTAADDRIVYLPRAGETGGDSFDYRLCEGSGRCTRATVWIER